MSRESDFITEARQHARALWDAVNALEALQKEWSALDYGNTLSTPSEKDGNAGLNAAAVGAVVFDTTDAIRALFNDGHATNVGRLL